MKQRILVVEDNLANRGLLCDWLQAEDFEVIEDLQSHTSRLLQSAHHP
jgi:CheY-like chemotaxis protein